MSIRLKLVLFISFLFISAIGNILYTFQLEKYGDEKLSWVNHTNEVLLETKDLLGSIKDMETGQRGYLLTEDISYLEPYYEGVNNSKEHFTRLKELTLDNPLQQKRLKETEKVMQLKFDEMAETIRLTQENHGNASVALAMLKKNNGKRYMDHIRKVAKDFTHTEMILLEERKGDFRAHKAMVITLIIGELLFFLFLAIMTISFLNKNLFYPLRLLLDSTHKMEDGERIDFKDLTSKDEMGYLLSSFLRMNEKVHTRTEVLDYKAHHDELTGLKNRVGVHDEIEICIKHLKETKNKFAVLFLDLNKFKQLNDTLGHDAGDIMLKETAVRLKSSVRSDDIVFRLGGDEFLILIKNVKHHSELEKIVSNIFEVAKAPVMIQGNPISISLSIGVAISPDDTRDSDEILKYSDLAMYEAKRDENSDYKLFDKSMLKRSGDLS